MIVKVVKGVSDVGNASLEVIDGCVSIGELGLEVGEVIEGVVEIVGSIIGGTCASGLGGSNLSLEVVDLVGN